MTFSLNTACFILFATFATASLSAPLGPLQLFSKSTVPSGWTAIDTPDPPSIVNLQIALKQNDIVGLQSKLLDISHPESTNYGKWLEREEVETYSAPSQDTIQTIKAWLTSYNISESLIDQSIPDWLQINIPVSQVEALLSTKYKIFQDSVSGTTLVRTGEYSLPQSLHDHIDLIEPTTSFAANTAPGPRFDTSDTQIHRKRQNSTSVCDPNHIHPPCILSYYNVTYTAHGLAPLGVVSLGNDSASHADLSQYLTSFYHTASNSTFASGSVLGGQNNESHPSSEGNLDTQISVSLVYPNPVTYYVVEPSPGNELVPGDDLLQLALYLQTTSSPPTAISTSYILEESALSSEYLTRVCDEYMKASTRGISIFFASGDDGVGGLAGHNCSVTGYVPIFPASCPWITAVESGEGGSSGGGFSNFFGVPEYQSVDTEKYIRENLNSSYEGLYNASGRGYPDIALVGKWYDIVDQGGVGRVYGTSASSPAWAALVSLLNDYRSRQGKPTLGFLNPLFYASGAVRDALRDVTRGHNPGCVDMNYGFPAAEGWDPTTGLGSLDFGKLLEALP